MKDKRLPSFSLIFSFGVVFSFVYYLPFKISYLLYRGRSVMVTRLLWEQASRFESDVFYHRVDAELLFYFV